MIGVAAAFAVAGCGGSGDETSGGSGSKQEFIAAANEICSRMGDEISAEAEKLSATKTDQILNFFEMVTLPKLSEEYDEIAALQPPEGDGAEIDAIVAAGRQAISESKQDPKLLLVSEGEPTPFDEANRLAGDYGIDQCAG